MSEQPPQPPASDPSAGGSDLEGYLRANRATVTEDALRRAALSAGHSPEAVDAALTATRDVAAPASGGSVVRRIFLSYLAVYLILDVLMLVNPANKQSGFLGDASGIGIVILSVALGGGFLASLIWIASRQAFWLLVGVGIALAGRFVDLRSRTERPFGRVGRAAGVHAAPDPARHRWCLRRHRAADPANGVGRRP
jgi:hypothetical protein